MNLGDFVRKYPPHAPDKQPNNDDELKQLGPEHGVRLLTAPPLEAEVRAVPQKKGDPGFHVWVMRPTEIPYVLARGAIARSLASGEVKHSNLTGGGLASCGGELWVDPVDATQVYLNGCSGRYGPQSAQQLNDAVAVIEMLGLRVESFGWNEELNMPALAYFK